MKLSCTKENLLAGLTAVNRIANKNLTLPILGNILLRAENNTLILSATNLEVGITTHVRSRVVESGAVTVQARLLTEFIGLLERERVDIESDGSSLKIAGEGNETTVRGMPAEDFPIIPAVPREKSFSVDAAAIREALEQTLFAAAQDSARPEISGACFSVKGNTLTLATTDSYRLAERSVGVAGAAASLKAIVPTKALFELSRIVPAEGTVQIFVGDTQALFVMDGTELTTRLVEGQYPDYTQIIPKDPKTEARIELAPFMKAVKTASLFARSGINDVTLSLEPEKKHIVLSSANTELGEHRGTVGAALTGPAVTIVFNFRYLLDGLSVMNASTVTLGVTDSGSPGIVRGVGGTAEYLYLIMPIRQ